MDMVTEGVYRIDVDEYQGTHRPGWEMSLVLR